MTHPTHRGGECTSCDGCGAHLDRHDSLHPCKTCEGTGKVEWAWWRDEYGYCDACGNEDVPVCQWGDDWICEPCALEIHANACGCDRWPKVPEEPERV